MRIRLRGFTHSLPLLAVLGLAIPGCGPGTSVLETKLLPEPKPTVPGDQLPQAYPRSQINDTRLREAAEEFKSWALKLRSGGATPAPLFSRVEILPPTRTVLPYGVGARQQEPRLPAILTIGPGWSSQKPEEKEALAARAFRELSRSLEILRLDRPLRPTLTIQTPRGMVLGWINDLDGGGSHLHGGDD